MRIDRILNNNVVIIKDENGEEQVVCGKGIAYKKKAGDLLSEKLINKVFVLKDTAQKQHFQEISLRFLWNIFRSRQRLWRCSHKHWKEN